MSYTTRRQLLQEAAMTTSAALGALAAGRGAWARPVPPTAPVGIARCATYEPKALTASLAGLLDKVGGLKRLVSGKTVVVKVNLTGSPMNRALGRTAGETFHVHPNMILATATLLDRAGAKRIRFVEGSYSTEPIEKTLLAVGWDLSALRALKAAVDFEDTRNLGRAKAYRLVTVPGGGNLFPAYMLNPIYTDCDVYISLAKMKNHRTAGVTLAMKNSFGITPTALYGQAQQNERTTNARLDILHDGKYGPAAGVPQELDPASPRVTSYRVPRHTVDVAMARPIDLAIIDGIDTVSGGEGPWYSLKLQKPNLLLAGRNAVCTDSIATACMGYDPMAASKTGPFPGDNHLAIAAARLLGTNDPSRIDVRGLTVGEALHRFQWEPDQRGI